ncbi:MAG: MFS transporter [Anaerolineales bacterium]
MDRAQLPNLWANPDFIKLWAGQTVSKFGTHITSAAMAATAVLVLQATPAQMGLLGAFAGLPVLLISLLAGVWVDRLRRKPILIAADLGRAFILLSIPLAALTGALSMWQLYVVAGLVGALTVLYNVADQSFLPAVVTRDRLVEANARIGASDALAEIAGPSLAGILVQWLSAPFAIFVDSSSYLFSATSLGLIRAREPSPAPREQPDVWREMVDGLRIVTRQPVLRALMGITATHRFFGSFIGTIYWLFLVRDLGLSPAIVGLSIGVGGIGALIGTLLAARLTRRFGVGTTLIGSLIAAALVSGLLLLPLTTWPVNVVSGLIFFIQLTGDIFWAVFLINVISLRQAIIPMHMLGRASASLDFVGEGAVPIGALVGGAIATLIGARWTWLLGAAGILAGSAWLIFSPVRRLHVLPTSPGLYPPAGAPNSAPMK